MFLPTLHTDHNTANTLRSVNFNYRVYQLAPYALIPGFIGHQTERSFANGTLAWTDLNVRDFDVLGLPYTLLSTVASGGLNLVHAMVPARDPAEYSLLPAGLLAFWREWLDWPTQHRAELDGAFPLHPPTPDAWDGWVTMEPSGLYGHLFLFNPNMPAVVASLVMDDALLLREAAAGAQGLWLLSEVWPRPAALRPFRWGERVNLTLDGDSAAVYEVRWVEWGELEVTAPLLVGVAAEAEVVSGDTLRIAGAVGEAGTTSLPITAWFPSAEAAAAVSAVVINGVGVAFNTAGNVVQVDRPLTFPGLHLPRSAQLGRVPDGFAGGNYSAVLRVSGELLEQLEARRVGYPIEWTAEELGVGWLAPHRLLVFVAVVGAQDAWEVTAMLDGAQVVVTKAYSSRHAVSSCFLGWFVDLTGAGVQAGVQYGLEVVLPKLGGAEFKGVFVQNIEPIIVQPTVQAAVEWVAVDE